MAQDETRARELFREAAVGECLGSGDAQWPDASFLGLLSFDRPYRDVFFSSILFYGSAELERP